MMASGEGPAMAQDGNKKRRGKALTVEQIQTDVITKVRVHRVLNLSSRPAATSLAVERSVAGCKFKLSVYL